jgi:hypothetical protein
MNGDSAKTDDVLVCVIDRNGELVADPGAVIVRQGQLLTVLNTTLDVVRIWFPEQIIRSRETERRQMSSPIEVAESGSLQLVVDGHPGLYPYAIYGRRRAVSSNGRFAVGNSSPGVIIRP